MENNTFEYTYSSLTERERKEIERIRRDYTPLQKDGNQDKIQRVKTLHAKIKNTATAFSITLGVVGCLIFGLGLTTILEWSGDSAPLLILGCGVGALGLLPMAVAYPVWVWLTQKGKKKHGEEILRLVDEILQENPPKEGD